MCDDNEGIVLPSVLYTRATAQLKEEIEEDLKKEDPEPEVAKAILNNE